MTSKLPVDDKHMTFAASEETVYEQHQDVDLNDVYKELLPTLGEIEQRKRSSQISNRVKDSQELNFHDLYCYDSNNEPIYFHTFKGKIVLVVNTATQCVSSYQLRQLEDLYQRYKHIGFTILAFPSDSFHQEVKGSDEYVADNCRLKYNVSFPIMSKIKVNGKNQNEVFKFLKEQKHGWLNTKRVKWNFEKFLIGRDGEILYRYSTLQKVSNKIEGDIQKYLKDEQINAAKGKNRQHIDKADIHRIVYI
ncbi:putative phospholipid hydroperoxide glutathione peroxidase [Wickerhamomyces ciferrii]|uniref:Glutathione peroxidase n=1 Tax=Wickerhamomyces ciferrii (strain ATCC 14091 / BCRC 22168 / CBS 111 / JCM 3599 / NBRC 0793 / NRRL Y-1031 F-60-10) TaxID=1206466 RepID=K0KHA8_WICCF|nr:putative phospholipid hydroperoxide glutathione peroxidase [Wickerhamomyces ciferrii]CCH40553.1 putative phospholipid hydroperoxide glutathione peroxidase [Wickerhamomyces ciferrii]